MSSLTIAIVVAFCIGYFFIAVESVTKVNKAAVALLMFVVCWTIFMVDPGSYLTAISGQDLPNVVSGVIEHHPYRRILQLYPVEYGLFLVQVNAVTL